MRPRALFLVLLTLLMVSHPPLRWQMDMGLGLAGEARASWQAEWEKTLEAAKKEGQVAVYHYGPEKRFLPFQTLYPEIRLVSVSSEAGPRIAAERRAGKYLADVYSGGSSTPYKLLYLAQALRPLPPAFILPEVVDRSKWWEGRHRWVDPERRYIFINEGTDQPFITRNTNMVGEAEITSYWDLLKPKWKGKILMPDPRDRKVTNYGLRFLYYHPELGSDYIRRLFGEMNIVFSRDQRQMIDWLAAGRYALGLFFTTGAAEAKAQGLPVDVINSKWLKEGGVIKPTGVGSVALMDRAPHPNAAKVLTNWYLSREGQLLIQKAMSTLGGADSLRIDIPKDDVPLEVRRRPGGKYLSLDESPETLEDKHIYDLVINAQASVRKK